MDESKQGSRDVNVRAVTKIGIGITGGVVVVAFLMWFLFDQFAARATRQSAQPEPMAASNPRKAPPEPSLQRYPVMELQTFRADEDAVPKTYGWIDEQKRI